MKWAREISQKITKLYLTSDQMTEDLKEAILNVDTDYPQKYFNAWFNESYQWEQGLRNTSAGSGTDYFIGYSEIAKELHRLQKALMGEYLLYKQGVISQKEYCSRAKPIDQAIDKMEMATLLQDSPAYEIPSLEHLR